jgi:hypothetical protein
VKSIAEITAHLDRMLKAVFGDCPADTPFTRGYEAALSLWKILIETGFFRLDLPVEEQLIPLCTTDNELYRAGFLEALIHVQRRVHLLRPPVQDGEPSGTALGRVMDGGMIGSIEKNAEVRLPRFLARRR